MRPEHRDALDRAREAVAIGRRLSVGDDIQHLPVLMAALQALGMALAAAGRDDDATPVWQEAALIGRRLVEAYPQAHRNRLTGTLSSLAPRLLDAADAKRTVAAAAEAVDAYRWLAAERPDIGNRGMLASALHDYGYELKAAGQAADSLEYTVEALRLRRAMAEEQPWLEFPLSVTLHNVANMLMNRGRHAEALEHLNEEVEILRRVDSEEVDEHDPDLCVRRLGAALHDVGVCLSFAERYDDAVTATTEAEEIRRRLAEHGGAEARAEWEATVQNLALQLTQAGRWDESEAQWHQIYQPGLLMKGTLAVLGGIIGGIGLAYRGYKRLRGGRGGAGQPPN
jgi:tetratricopeptide (TPR) repeat protein